jgi:Cu2+-exporting ATPase
MAGPATDTCPHCGNPSDLGARHAPFCCTGCQAVFALLSQGGLGRYYELGGRDGVPVAPSSERRTIAWLDPLLAAIPEGPRLCILDLDVQGIHCAGCVWLMNELFRRRGGAAILVNPALGKVRLTWERSTFDVPAFIEEVERFGYLFGPSLKEASRGSRDLPLRMGICAAIAMNVMMFSISFYLGLAPSDGALFGLFTRLSLWLSAAAVAIGGRPFFKTAAQGLRHGVLHLDFPIATGILLAFTTSLLRAGTGRGDLAYFDTLDVFITLMLVGRWLQQRVLDRNRRFLLQDAGADGIHVRREDGNRLAVVPAPLVARDDVLLVAPGDLIPVEAELLDDGGVISTDWITGESKPRTIARHDTVVAGAFNAGTRAFRIRATQSFAQSPLIALLAANRETGNRPAHVAFVQRVARVYVPVVVVLAIAGAWLWHGHGWASALDVAAAILIVTCPCALGIAVPLAEELALATLRRDGVFVRSGDLLDRAVRIRRVLFDKTGTLTLGKLALTNAAVLDALSEIDRDALYDLTSRSNHPVSRAIASELAVRGARFSFSAVVDETPGAGLQLTRDGRAWRLGRHAWAIPGNATGCSHGDGTFFSVDGHPIVELRTHEAIRSDARSEITRLKEAGVDAWLVSGDAPERVLIAADELGIPSERALAQQSPEDKASAVASLDHSDTLFVGDGVNDSLAFSVAFATATPAIDRPVMPGKADFFLLGEGIAGVRKLLDAAHVLRATIRRILVTSQLYNAAAIALSLAGFMTPLRAAVAMPASSLTVIALAMAGSSQRKRGTAARKALHAPPVTVPRIA